MLAGMFPRLRILPAVLLILLMVPTGSYPATAQPRSDEPSVRVIPNRELSFGTFMVFGSGSRTISARGAVSDQGVVALEGARTRPARFTILYDKGRGKNDAIDVSVEIVISTPSIVRENGVSAHLSAFQTDLPGYGRVSTGQVLKLRIDNCRSRRCSRSFNVGGQLHVTRQFGGSNIVVPIELDARVVAVDPI